MGEEKKSRRATWLFALAVAFLLAALTVIAVVIFVMGRVP
jgi:hypothetical protein